MDERVFEDDTSFDDSEQFEDDSQVSLDGSVDDSCQNWRGWVSCASSGEAVQPGLSCVVYQYPCSPSGRYSSSSTSTVVARSSKGETSSIMYSLAEMAAQICAEQFSFQQLEETYQWIISRRHNDQPILSYSIPEKIFLSIIVYCFPKSTEEIRMYSTLANGSCDQYNFGNTLYQVGGVKDVSQTGFLLSANVYINSHESVKSRISKQSVGSRHYHVTVKVDRCRIVECTCECSTKSTWCQHVVALCLYRIHQKQSIKFKETIADAINSMSDFELRKLVQWHINEIPRKCIPGFQKLIDKIKDPNSEINQIFGAPDPTDSGQEAVARNDFPDIADKIRRLLCKYCVPPPSVHCDVQYLSATQNPTTIEWNSLVKPLRAREPEGMWNLLQMVREMLARGDDNAVALLRTITDECLTNTQVLLWWFVSKLLHSGHWSQQCNGKMQTQMLAQFNCALLCDEVVSLWRCVAMNPRASKSYISQLAGFMENYHRTTVNRLKCVIGGSAEESKRVDETVLSNHQTQVLLQGVKNEDGQTLSAKNVRFTLDLFPGFYPALKMCHYLCENEIDFGLPTDAHLDVEAPNLSKAVKIVTPKVSKKSKKKRKKNNKGSGRNQRQAESDAAEEFESIGVWRVYSDRNRYEKEESGESGHESDLQQPSSSRQPESDVLEMDVNEMLAAAFTPLDAIESRFLKCEGYATHGYMNEAYERAIGLIDYLLDNLSEQAESLKTTDAAAPKTTPTSSQDDTDSEKLTTMDVESNVSKANKFLGIMEKILYVSKILRAWPSMYMKVFWFSLKALSVVRYPLATKYQQIKLYYLETEFVAIVQQLSVNVPIGKTEMAQIREAAKMLLHTGNGSKGEVPSIALAQFVFESLHADMDNLSHNMSGHRLNESGDDELALNVALTLLGSTPRFSEADYPIHCEAVRRQKNDLAVVLLNRFKESQGKIGLVIDKLLDPSLHRMYTHHQSNAAYFLERDPVYQEYHKNHERPVFPYRHEKDKSEDQTSPCSSSSASSCGETQATTSYTYGLTKNNMDTWISTQFSKLLADGTSDGTSTKCNRGGASSKKRMKRRIVHQMNPVCSATEAHVYHMQELAKKVLLEAGGSQSSVVFALGQPSVGGTHRKLHLCAVIIGVYAMGMHNRISPSWNTRTYSSWASWIAAQAQEIGPTAIEMIRETWSSHFTPREISGLSDRAIQSSDPEMRKEACRLALSVLPYAHSLKDDEIVRALDKCREHSRNMLICGLSTMDTPAFRQTAPIKTLFTAMQHWMDLSAEEEAMAARIEQQNRPTEQVMNYGMYSVPPPQCGPPPPPQQQQQQQQQQPPPQQFYQQNPSQYLFVDSRIHQSHSAPQLSGTVPSNAYVPPMQPEDEGASSSQPLHVVFLINSFQSGIRAMECMATSVGDDRPNYLKYTQNPPYLEEVSKLYHISVKLGVQNMLTFFNTVVRCIYAPYVLHYYAVETMKHFPHRPYCAPPPLVPTQSQPGQMIPPLMPPSFQYQIAPRWQHQQARFAQPGVICSLFVQNGYHHVTGELFERACDQYLLAIINKMNNPRYGILDNEDLCCLLRQSRDCFKWIPGPMSKNLFDDFVRTFKKQKSFKKDMANSINSVLNTF